MTRDYSFTQNRELSWLKFDKRVLMEAEDKNVPLLERLKFISIFDSNLDEFCMVRCGTLHDISNVNVEYIDNKSGLNAQEQLDAIFEQMKDLYKLKDHVYSNVCEKLEKYGIKELSFNELTSDEKKYVEEYFRDRIFPILSPQLIDFQHPFPNFKNNALNIVVVATNGKGDKKLNFGFIKFPPSLEKMIILPGEDIRFILMENVILEYVEKIFKHFNIIYKTVMCVTRNADVTFVHEQIDAEENYRDLVKQVLKKRLRLAPIRLEFYKKQNKDLTSFLIKNLHIKNNQVQIAQSPLDMSYVYDLVDYIEDNRKTLFDKLSYKPFDPLVPQGLDLNKSIISQVEKKDYLFSYPFESMDNFLKLLKEASRDPNVVSIKITIYRLAKGSKIAQYLLEAVDNGIEVTALIELRARFDEQHNIHYAELLEEAGCNVIYGFEDYKVHSKICLITRKKGKKYEYITQLGTGNYNEKTSKIYTDLSYITSRQDIGEDAVKFFQNMSLDNLNGHYEKLIVSPTSFKSSIINKIHEEIEKAKNGKNACIIMKMNSLTDRELIDLLKKASKAGVKVNLIIRGICCILPGIPNITENIRVISIVGRFLEHSRIYCFGEDDDRAIYLSSADLMTRNTEKRVEIGFPIEDAKLKKRIIKMVELMLSDNVKAREIDSNGDYNKIAYTGEPISSQDIFMTNQFYEKVPEAKKESFIEKLKNLFK
ncbi:polyphosphate kinase 1 [Methanobrevibacter woesei]|uniref:polyphosphate kinase 1 n=1 Tax=Methanobrevibacter woesei TaxID=190976 RepID=UPI0023F07EB1|nr:polyphosphate kinase 1 [Methanobrevibacter woesei]